MTSVKSVDIEKEDEIRAIRSPNLANPLGKEIEMLQMDEEEMNFKKTKLNEKINKIQQQLQKELKVKQATETMLVLYNQNNSTDPKTLANFKENQAIQTQKINLLTKQLEQLKQEQRENVLLSKSMLNQNSLNGSFTASTFFNNESALLNEDVFYISRKASTLKSWRFKLSHFNASNPATEIIRPSQKKRTPLSAIKSLIQNVSELFEKVVSNEVILQSKLEALNSIYLLVKLNSNVGFSDDILDNFYSKIRIVLCYPIPEIKAFCFRILRFLTPTASLISDCLYNFGIEVFLIRSLCKEHKDSSKVDCEREHAFRLIRWFVFVNASERSFPVIPASILRVLFSLCEISEDRLRFIALETVIECCFRDLERSVNNGALRWIFHTFHYDVMQGVTSNQTQQQQQQPQPTIQQNTQAFYNSNGSGLAIPLLSYILDQSWSRSFMRRRDIDCILAVFTDCDRKVDKSGQQTLTLRIKQCTPSLLQLFKTWNGLVYLCSENLSLIRCIVQCMKMPYDEVKKALVEFLLELFAGGVKTVAMITAGINFGSLSEGINLLQTNNASDKNSVSLERANLVEHHLALILAVFIEAELLETLMSIVEDSVSMINKDLVVKTTILLAEIMNLCNILLPSFLMRTQSLQKLFLMAANFRNEICRSLGSSVLTSVDKTFAVNYQKPFQLGSVKLKIGMLTDDAQLKILLNDSQVLLTKEFMKWNWDHVDELLSGILLNPKKLEDVIKNTKFIRRLLTFYRPKKKRFSDMKYGKTTSKFLNTGIQLLMTLLNAPEGMKLLQEHKFLNELRDCLLELDPMNSYASSAEESVIFTKERMSEGSMVVEYFKMIGLLSKYKEGVDVLCALKFYDLFYKLTELKSRDDVVFKIIEVMDYKSDGHNRILLSKVLTSGYKHIRLFATNFLRVLLRNYNNTSGNEVEQNIPGLHLTLPPSSGSTDWIIKLLIGQLYDPALDVCERAVIVLDEACLSASNLRILIEEKPYLDHLREVANPILFRFLSSPLGFYYLHEVLYLEKELNYWFKEGNLKYVVQLELSLLKALQAKYPVIVSNSMESKLVEEMSRLGMRELAGVQISSNSSPSGALNHSPISSAAAVSFHSDSLKFEQDGVCLPHFYGELTKTEQGCVYLRQIHHFETFHNIIESAIELCQKRKVSSEDLMEVKAALWAVGNIAFSSRGLVFLQELNSLSKILELAEKTTVLSLKGTCFYVIGLISKNPEAAMLLEDYGWSSNTTFSNYSSEKANNNAGNNAGHISATVIDQMQNVVPGLAIPVRIRKFFRIGDWEDCKLVDSEDQTIKITQQYFHTEDPIEKEILKAVGNLSNHVLANAASKTLNKLKHENIEYFGDKSLYQKSLKILSTYHYRLTARKFINDLFDAVDMEEMTGLDR